MDPIRLLRQHWRPAAVAALLMLATVAWYAWPSSTSAAEAALTAPVKQGDFKVVVTTTGELRARKFVQVSGPATAQSVQVYQTKIASIVPEGTVVKEGDVIAELDRQPRRRRSSPTSRSTLQKAQADFTHRAARLDAQPRAGARGRAHGGVRARGEEARARSRRSTRRRRSSGRPRSTTRRRSARSSSRSATCSTKTKQAVAKMSSVGADLGRQQNNLKNLQDVRDQLHGRAPAPGMVIYVREWNGKKKGVGSHVERLGADRRHAARPHADGVADLRQRGRRPEARRRPEGADLARRRSDEEARRHGDRTSPTSASSGPTRTRRCSR